jgi:enoyl-CoA hydratase/carnithine racemase
MSSSPEDPVLLERRGGLALLTLNRPRVHNAVDRPMIRRLEQHLDTLDAHPEVRVVVLTGAGGRTFCAGSDLEEFTRPGARERGLEIVTRMQAVLDRLSTGPRVTLAALDGGAYGGGCELITACHLRFAGEGARFSFRQAAMGVTTGWGGGGRLFRLVGRSTALRLLLGAEVLDAAEAHRLGLVDFLLPAGEALDSALAFAERILANGREAITGFLELADAAHRSPAEVLELERRLFVERYGGERFWGEVERWKARRGG